MAGHLDQYWGGVDREIEFDHERSTNDLTQFESHN